MKEIVIIITIEIVLKNCELLGKTVESHRVNQTEQNERGASHLLMTLYETISNHFFMFRW